MARRGVSRREGGSHQQRLPRSSVSLKRRAHRSWGGDRARDGLCVEPRPADLRCERRGRRPAILTLRQPATGEHRRCDLVGGSCDGHGRQRLSARAVSPAPSSKPPSCSPPPGPLRSVGTARLRLHQASMSAIEAAMIRLLPSLPAGCSKGPVHVQVVQADTGRIAIYADHVS